MTISLYDATVPTFIQIIASSEGILNKAETWCDENGQAEEELIQCRLIEDMFPFAYQIKSLHTHSVGALEGLKAGVFSPNFDEPPTDFAGLKQKLNSALDYLHTLDKNELNAMVGKDMRFEFRDYNIPFRAETFLFSFTQPNFFFHATTAYDILRSRGVPVGKLDFLGALRKK